MPTPQKTSSTAQGMAAAARKIQLRCPLDGTDGYLCEPFGRFRDGSSPLDFSVPWLRKRNERVDQCAGGIRDPFHGEIEGRLIVPTHGESPD